MSVWKCVFASFFFFKQKTAYEVRISDWSSDVCSSDLPDPSGRDDVAFHRLQLEGGLEQGLRVLGLGILEDPVGGALLDHLAVPHHDDQIGRASCRERVCQYV